MALVVGLHGILQEQKGRHQLEPVWQQGLADGVDAAAGRSAAIPSLEVCFYGRLFLPASALGVRQTPGKGEDLDDALNAPVEDDDQAFLEDVVSQVEASSESSELPPGKGAPPVPEVLQPLARRLSRRFKGSLTLQFLSVLRQVKIYLDDDAMADQIRATFLTHVHETRPRVVIAHSLGSVVAVDALSLNPDTSVRTLITVGSPLGMRAVQERLRRPTAAAGNPVAFPGNVSRWVNVFDPADPVAVAGGLSRIWPMVEDYTVGNGKDPHGILRYLGKPITGQVILDGVAD